MKILALESSAVAASVAICEGEQLIAQSFLHTGLTHSQTLLPMVAGLLEDTKLSLDEIDLLSVAVGPGSFTGLRIGVSALKGLAWSKNIPCAPCSTLEAMAWGGVGLEGELCGVMDARRKQVYNARFSSDGLSPRRLCPDRAISIEELGEELRQTESKIWLLGDGAELCYHALGEQCPNLRLAPGHLRMQMAWGVARCGLDLLEKRKVVSGDTLAPVYLRLSQAERERQEREGNVAE